MKTFHLKLILLLLIVTIASTVWGQPASQKEGKAIIITGARFTYPLIQKWIDDYNKVNPSVQIIIESRGTSDPSSYDILAEAYDQDESVRKTREYISLARYPILPVANSRSAFARYYADKGLNRAQINQIYFDDLYSDKEKELAIKGNYNVYNRLQKAGAAIVFTHYFGREQKDIKGKAIAGSDEHLLKALLRDSVAVSYLPLTLVYNHTTGLPLNGLVVLPVDLNDNERIGDDEKFYTSLGEVVQHLSSKDKKDISNLPVGYIHFSVSKGEVRKEAIDFIQWVIASGQQDLAAFGYLNPEAGRFEKEKSDFFKVHHPN